MPMIPEAAIAMLGCARIGAVHSGVFGGFAANELASRIDDSKAKIILSASCGYEPGKTIEYKPLLKKAIELAKHKVEKSIINSNLGFNPVNNGESIIINIPPLTEERRIELTKVAKSESDSAKVTIRNIRQDSNQNIKSLEISEDLKSNNEIDIQELTDKYIKIIDDMFSSKEKDILTV